MRSFWLSLCLFYSFVVQFAGMRASVASLQPLAEQPPITEAPQVTLGKLRKMDSPICCYVDGNARKCNPTLVMSSIGAVKRTTCTNFTGGKYAFRNFFDL